MPVIAGPGMDPAVIRRLLKFVGASSAFVVLSIHIRIRKYSPKAWNLEELVWRGLEEFSNAGHHECLASPN